jgi:hypothetical protein
MFTAEEQEQQANARAYIDKSYEDVKASCGEHSSLL